ncbi:N-acetyltransferase [Mycobacterium sp. MYCO198283]|uniref:GNAT family N-acetyltransferase n=1 Tax=Mycobacterium sp. MYCO198283 TaxID=2883505 RepID=UPI001E4AF2B4|nr:GNAT family N-acetyltransferase [Mycobacterium sp. MYCO198283]MCG5433059.1 N-acetyltransferase [Mycobacterium sp. MYCO198283]
MTTDKTGAATTVSPEPDRFTIAVEGKTVGLAEYADRDQQRIFTHTKVDEEYEGRGLATILIGEALEATRDAGMRIVPMCAAVASYVDKHPEYSDYVDPPGEDITTWLRSR